MGFMVLGLLFLVGYFVIYRKVLGGNKKPSARQMILYGLFTIYIIMVIGITFLNRADVFHGSMNLHFFSSYREAWHGFTLRGWQFIIFNIWMFAPLGFLLPLLHERFRQIKWTMGAALGFTLFIEFTQAFTGLGIFELDDIFNNTLGAFIGYGMIMAIFTIWGKAKKPRMVLAYLTPLILVTVAFVGMFTYYNEKEFGNLWANHSYVLNMKDTKIVMEEALEDERTSVPIYEAVGYTAKEAEAFARNFFNGRNIDTSSFDIDAYNDRANFWAHGEPGYNLWVYYLDGSYSYTDTSAFHEAVDLIHADEETLLYELNEFGIEMPESAEFAVKEEGSYQWHVDKEMDGDQLIDGNISCEYYSDQTIKILHNNLITYNKVREVAIISGQEAYEKILAGKFNMHTPDDGIESIEIHHVELDYLLDTKGYYQPVYAFHSMVDGNETTILIPAML